MLNALGLGATVPGRYDIKRRWGKLPSWTGRVCRLW